MEAGRLGRARREEMLRRAGKVVAWVSSEMWGAYIGGIVAARVARGLPTSVEAIAAARRKAALGRARRCTELVAEALRAGLSGMVATLAIPASMVGHHAVPARAMAAWKHAAHQRWLGKLGRAGIPHALVFWRAEPTRRGLPHYHVLALVPPGATSQALELLRLSVFRQKRGSAPVLPSLRVLWRGADLDASSVQTKLPAGPGLRGQDWVRWVDYVHKSATWRPEKLAAKGSPDALTYEAWAWANGVVPATTPLDAKRVRQRIQEVASLVAGQGWLGGRPGPDRPPAAAPSGNGYLWRYRSALEAELRRRAGRTEADRAIRAVTLRNPVLCGDSTKAVVAGLEALLRRHGANTAALVPLRLRAGLPAPTGFTPGAAQRLPRPG